MPEIYTNSPSIRPLDNSFRFKSKGQFFLQERGKAAFGRGGDFTSFAINPTIEENEVTSNEFPEKTLALVDLTTADISIAFTARMLTPFLRRAAMLSRQLQFDQASVSARSVTVKIPVGQLYKLPHIAISAIEVSGPAGEDMFDGVHYECDRETGMVLLVAAPDGTILDADGAIEIAILYDADATTRLAFGFMSQTDIRCTIEFRQKMKFGPQLAARFHDVQLRPEGEIPLGGDGQEFGEMGFVGRVFADPTQPPGFQLGMAYDIPKAAA